MKGESLEAQRNRRIAATMSCIELALQEARLSHYYTTRYYEPLKRRRVVRLAKWYSKKDEVSVREVEAVLDMTVAEALGIEK